MNQWHAWRSKCGVATGLGYDDAKKVRMRRYSPAYQACGPRPVLVLLLLLQDSESLFLSPYYVQLQKGVYRETGSRRGLQVGRSLLIDEEYEVVSLTFRVAAMDDRVLVLDIFNNSSDQSFRSVWCCVDRHQLERAKGFIGHLRCTESK